MSGPSNTAEAQQSRTSQLYSESQEEEQDIRKKSQMGEVKDGSVSEGSSLISDDISHVTQDRAPTNFGRW